LEDNCKKVIIENYSSAGFISENTIYFDVDTLKITEGILFGHYLKQK
jgi:hypothetical protein